MPPAEPTAPSAGDPSRPTPAPLDVVEALCNTVNLMRGYDLLDTVQGARRWIETNPATTRTGLTPGDLAADDLPLLRAVRHQLRAAMSTTPDPDAAPSDQDPDVAAQVPLVLSAAGTGALTLMPHPGSPLVAGTIVAAAANAGAQTWSRLHPCQAPNCQWVFYDTSRSHTRRWCDMNICGARTKMRRHRNPHPTDPPAGPPT